MLWRLQIENYALIDRMVLDFDAGFNVLSGETGSGKSIIVDALGLLLGERADAGAIRAGGGQATVTGTFAAPFATSAARAAWCAEHGLGAPDADEGEEITLRREVAASGRSRAFVDNQPVTLALLRDLAGRIGDVHAQGEALAAFTPAAQLELLDRFAAIEPERDRLAAAHALWRGHSQRLDDWREHGAAGDADLWRFQLAEIEAAGLSELDEDARLEQERLRLVYVERIAAAAAAVYDRLYEAPEAVTAQLKAALRHVQDWERFDASASPLVPRLEAAQLEVRDIAERVRDLAGDIEASPARLRELDERLEALDRLKRKYGPTLEAVAQTRTALANKLDRLENAAAHEAALTAAAKAAAADYRKLAAELGHARKAAAARLEPLLVAEAAELGMQLRFAAALESEPAESGWTPSGWDRVRFQVSANPGEPLQPLDQVASGGELSRLLLALHLIAERGARHPRALPPRTLVLDEIDTGIGGRAAEAVGAKLQQLGAGFQVLCVTHLAQIATFADRHLHVHKQAVQGRTHTEVRRLETAARAEEVARMLSGNELSPTALRHARELLSAHTRGRATSAR